MHVMHMQFMMPNHDTTTKEELMDLCQMMTIKQFTYDFNQKILDIDSDLAKDFLVFLFIHGLKPDVKAQVQMQAPMSLTEAITKADNVDQALYAAQVTKHSTSGCEFKQ